jgi:excisionase family DNA binding protein
MGFALELEIDPQDPSRLKVELIPRPVSTGRFVTVRQASRLLRVSPEAVRRALTAGQLRGIKIGRQWRVCLERPRWLMPGQPTEEE